MARSLLCLPKWSFLGGLKFEPVRYASSFLSVPGHLGKHRWVESSREFGEFLELVALLLGISLSSPGLPPVDPSP